MHHHNDLIHYERVIAPKYTAPAQHHRQRNVRSLGMSCDDMELIMQQLKNQSQISLQTLKDNVEVLYIKPRFNSTLEASLRNWSKSKLNLSHPYQKLLDRNFTKTVGSHDFSHLKNYANINELLKAELNKIYTTINMLNFVIKRLHKEIKTKEQMETSFNEGLNNITKYLEITADQIVNNLEITKSAMGALQIEKENFDEKSVTYNETISAKDWLMVVENISFTHYMDQLYTLLLRMCSPLQSKANTTNF